MRKLLCYLLLGAAMVSCQKKTLPTGQREVAENLNSPVLKSNVSPGATDSITMDVTGDYVNAGDNHIKNNTTGMHYWSDQEGAGYADGNALPGIPIYKTAAARYTNSYALRFIMPARSASVTYKPVVKDRLESHIFTSNITDVNVNVHYSGFSLYIPSGQDTVHSWFVIHQWWQSAPESPAIAFELDSGYYARLKVAVRYGVKQGVDYHTRYLPRKDTTATNVKFIDLPRNTWIDFIVRWKFATTDSSGVCAVYRHNASASSSTLLFDYTGPIGYSDVNNSNGVQEKFGIYRKASFNKQQIIYDQLRVGPSWNSVKPWL
ncbi:MAG: heparin lyase I family protein [Bacteroidota bacterium]